ERVDAAALRVPHGFTGPGDVAGNGAGEAGNDRVLDLFRHRDHRLEVAVRGDREARFDDVDAHFVERFGDLQLFFERHARARVLLAFAQRGVEDVDPVLVALGRLLGGHLSSSYQAAGTITPSRPDKTMFGSILASPDHPPAIREPPVLR